MVAVNAAKRRRRPRPDRDSGERGGDEIIARVKERVAGATRYMTEQARSVSRQVQQATSETSQALLQTVREEAERAYAKQKGRAVARVKGMAKIGKQAAHALHAVKADKAAEYVEQASRRVGRATGYLEDHTLTEIMEDAGDVVRRNQALAVGGLFVAGFVVTRFLKAGASQRNEARSDADEDTSEDEERGRIESADRNEDEEEEDSDRDEAVDEYDQAENEGDRDEDEDAEGALDSRDDEGEEQEDQDAEDEGDSPDDPPAARRGNASRERTPGRERSGR